MAHYEFILISFSIGRIELHYQPFEDPIENISTEIQSAVESPTIDKVTEKEKILRTKN